MKMGRESVCRNTRTCCSLERALKPKVEVVSSVHPICHPTSNHQMPLTLGYNPERPFWVGGGKREGRLLFKFPEKNFWGWGIHVC